MSSLPRQLQYCKANRAKLKLTGYIHKKSGISCSLEQTVTKHFISTLEPVRGGFWPIKTEYSGSKCKCRAPDEWNNKNIITALKKCVGNGK